MVFQRLRKYSTWMSQVSAVVSLIAVVFLRSKFIFESGNTAGMLVLFAMVTWLLTLIFGVAALPRWQGFAALGIFGVLAYNILVEPLYALA